MPCVQLSHNILGNCIDNRQNQLFSEMSLRDVMELPKTKRHLVRNGLYVTDCMDMSKWSF